MTYAELSEAQTRRSRQFAEAQTDVMSVYCDAERDLKDLQAENAKLRELCVEALGWLRWAGGITCPPEVPDEFADALRELGVEVPS